MDSILEEESSISIWHREEYAMRRNDEEDDSQLDDGQRLAALQRRRQVEARRAKHNKLTVAICGLLDDYCMVSFIPMNIKDEESIDHVLMHIDHTVQYGEDQEVRGADLDNNVEDNS